MTLSFGLRLLAFTAARKRHTSMMYITSHVCNVSDMPQVGLHIQTRFAFPLVFVFFRWNTEDNMEKDQQILKHPVPA